jgi:hypothetical protein
MFLAKPQLNDPKLWVAVCVLFLILFNMFLMRNGENSNTLLMSKVFENFLHFSYFSSNARVLNPPHLQKLR